MTDVVALVLEPAAVLRSEHGDDPRDVAKRVLEDEIVGRAEVGFFPVVLPGLIAIGQREDPEIHAAHVERAHLRTKHRRRLQAIVDGHVQAAAGRDVDDRLASILEPRQKCQVGRGIRRWPPVARIAGVHVQDGRTGPSCRDSLLRQHVG
jgi:hypothetical protein